MKGTYGDKEKKKDKKKKLQEPVTSLAKKPAVVSDASVLTLLISNNKLQNRRLSFS